MRRPADPRTTGRVDTGIDRRGRILEQPMGRFTTTRWSQVVAAGADDRAALAWLCERYWEPLRAHLRRRCVELHAAEDMTQDFFAAVLDGSLIQRANPARGRFRTFLLACLEHHLAHRRERELALKRGGGAIMDALADAPAPGYEPTRGFDRAWAETLLERVRDRLRAEGDARTLRLQAFLTTNGDSAAYAAAGTELGLSEGAVRVTVHRLRARFRELLRAEVAETLAHPTPAAIDAEIGDLLAALRENL
jgi:RNA polymerase sigma-70 factor (ECF subfamily)